MGSYFGRASAILRKKQDYNKMDEDCSVNILESDVLVKAKESLEMKANTSLDTNSSELNEKKCSNLYSESELMRIIESFITKHVLSLGYKEWNLCTNIKISLYLIASCLAIYASVFITFPDDVEILKRCLVFFFIVVLITIVLDFFILQSVIIITSDFSEGKIRIEAFIDASTGNLNLSIKQNGKELTDTTYLGEIFDSDRNFIPKTLENCVNKLLNGLEPKKKYKREKKNQCKASSQKRKVNRD